jgi:hypothetical protein
MVYKADFSTLKGIAESHGGKVKRFDQQLYKGCFQNNEGVELGVCRALCADYLYRNATRAIQKSAPDSDSFEDTMWAAEAYCEKFFAVTHSNLPQSDAENARWEHLRSVQIESQKKDGKLIAPSNWDDVIEAGKSAVASTTANHLHFVEQRVCVPGGAPLTSDIAPDSPSYWLLSSGAHMVAWVTRNQGGNWKGKFFDPNTGQTVFKDKDQSVGFLTAYLLATGHGVWYFLRFGR